MNSTVHAIYSRFWLLCATKRSATRDARICSSLTVKLLQFIAVMYSVALTHSPSLMKFAWLPFISTFITHYSLFHFFRTMLFISTAYAVMRGLSVRLSVTFVYSVETNKHVFNFFILLGSHTILVFSVLNVMAIFRRRPLTVTSNAGDLGKKCNLGHCLAFLLWQQ